MYEDLTWIEKEENKGLNGDLREKVFAVILY